MPRVTISLVQQYPKKNHAIGRFRLVVLVGESAESIVAGDVKRLIAIGSEKWTNDGRETITDWLTHFDPAASALAKELTAAEASGPKPPLMDVRVLAQRKQARETRLLYRGEFLSPKDPVAPGTPAILPPLTARDGEKPDRLDYARWLVSRENPLTARVIANQIWMRLFGEGIVRTPADFGVRGEKPSHGELLDWLASEFTDRGWSRKHLIRLIMNSGTYRQRADVRPELSEFDPRNTLLARQNRLRAEGEIVRDLHLAAGGLLANKIGGPSVYPPMPPEIAALSYANNFKWNESKGEDRYRRGMYTYWCRSFPHPSMLAFDAPSREECTVERPRSSTPLQALILLNDPTYLEAARAFAGNILREGGATAADRLQYAGMKAVSRRWRAEEFAVLEGLLNKHRDEYRKDPAAADKVLKVGDAAIAKDADRVELAAWTSVARAILNLHESITRN